MQKEEEEAGDDRLQKEEPNDTLQKEEEEAGDDKLQK